MAEILSIPIFPLNILPQPHEYIPLHIFEPRYRQLLEDLQEKSTGFGIFYTSMDNNNQLGSYLTLESVLKNYPTGESDILCKCTGVFLMLKYFQHFENKLYPGGQVHFLPDEDPVVSKRLEGKYRKYLALKKVDLPEDPVHIHDIANDLNQDDVDRLRYLQLIDPNKKNEFLMEQLRYRVFILEQEEQFKDNFNLN